MKFYKQIFLFNKPMYIVAFVALCIGFAGMYVFRNSWLFNILIVTNLAAIYLTLGSLFFSYLIYDRSSLYRFSWLHSFLQPGAKLLNVFVGYGESAHALNAGLKDVTIAHADLYAADVAQTSSIQIAKQFGKPVPATAIPFGNWSSLDAYNVILCMQSLHELRPATQKINCLNEAKTHLLPGGKIIVAEHLCDVKNFLIYGPGAFHFFGEAHWLKVFTEAGLEMKQRFTVTPFIHVFILQPKILL